MKIVTICGSMKFKDKMMEVAKDLEIKNKYVVIQCVYSNDKFNEEEQSLLADLKNKKIDNLQIEDDDETKTYMLEGISTGICLEPC